VRSGCDAQLPATQHSTRGAMGIEEDLQARLDSVRACVAAAARRVGRQPEEVEIIAVSKTVEPERIAALARLGLRYFGENRVEEAEAKLPQVEALLGTARPRWCLVGHLQSRKVRRAVALFDEVHSLDSIGLALRLERAAAAQGRRAGGGQRLRRRGQVRLACRPLAR